jgi:predicted RND superfamily exporter protein
LLALVLRHLVTTIKLFAGAMTGPAVALVLIKSCYGTMDIVTAIIPIMLFILNVSLGFHLYYSMVALGKPDLVLRQKRVPIALMLATTTIGFASLCSSDITAVARFGLMSSVGLCVSGLWHLAFFYLVNTVWKSSHANPVICDHSIFQRSVRMAYIIPLSLVIITASIVAAKNLVIESEALFYFPEAHWLRQDQNFIEQRVFGNPNFEVLLSTQQQDSNVWNDLDLLRRMDDLEKNILTRQEFKHQQILSPVQLLKRANATYGQSAQLPAHTLALAPLFNGLMAQMGEEELNRFGREGYYRFVIHGPHVDHQNYLAMKAALESQLQGLQFELSGPYFAMRMGQDSLIKTLFWSLAGSLIIILLGSAAYYRNTRVIGAFTLVNILPLFAAVAIMAITGLSLNIATVMSFSIALGLVVDGTYHLIHDHQQNIDAKTRLVQTLSPIIVSNLLLIVSFAAFALNDFLPIRHFGLTLSISLMCGLLADVYLLARLIGGRVP